MALPFTRDQFFDVFAAYNTSLWPFALALWLLTVGSILMFARGARGAPRLVCLTLAIQWAWAALAYHAAFFWRINPAAWFFAALFLLEGGLLAWKGVLLDTLQFSGGRSPRHYLSGALVAYALLYPAIVWADGNPYPRLPTFGVPCPTTILTIGFLLAANPPGPGVVALIPIAWALIGGSAALLLGVRADLMLAAAGICLAVSTIRVRCRRWGVSDAELSQPMPGDKEVSTPNYVAMAAVTIDAPPEYVWPWLVQMGQGRGGLYSYDWLDRLFGYLDRPSADRILPQFQHLAVGDVIPVGGSAGGFPVKAITPGAALVLGGEAEAFQWTWQFALIPVNRSQTRLIARNQARVPRSISTSLFMLALEPAAFIMTRKMLLGIRQRAEALCRDMSRRSAHSLSGVAPTTWRAT